MFELISILILSVIVIVLLFDDVYLRVRKKKHIESIIQLNVDKSLLIDTITKLGQERESKSIEQSDGFLKFVSESRDWAFKYIEDVQAGIKKFTDVAGPEIKYLNTYGKVSDYPQMASVDKISEAYFDLEKLLPSENKDQV